MAMNEKTCTKCSNYAAISLGDGSRKANRGWCVAKSVYPNQEQPGHIIPDGAKRAAPGEQAVPHIVIGAEVVPHCTDFRAK